MGSLTVEDGDDVLPTTMTPLTLDDFDGILAKYVGNEMKLALLLDYDGTLAPICPHPDLATIPEETKRVCDTEVQLYIVPLLGTYFTHKEKSLFPDFRATDQHVRRLRSHCKWPKR